MRQTGIIKKMLGAPRKERLFSAKPMPMYVGMTRNGYISITARFLFQGKRRDRRGENMSKPLMQCGHAANSVDLKTGEPSCVICVGIKEGWNKSVSPPDLAGRTAVCSLNKHGEVP